MTVFLSSGVYYREFELERRSLGAVAFRPGIPYQSHRGPVGEAVFYAGFNQWLEVNGNPDLSVGVSHLAIQHAFDGVNSMYGYRIPGAGARYAQALLAQRRVFSAPTTFDATEFIPLTGSIRDASGGFRPVYDLVFSTALVASNSIAMSINGNAISPVAFSQNNNNTLRLLRAPIQTVLNLIGSNGSTWVADSLTTAPTDQHIIRVIAPEDGSGVPIPLTFTGFTVTGGAGQPTTTAFDAKVLMNVAAENPGAWANNVAMKFTRTGAGIPERHRLTLSAALVASNTLDATINGFPITQVVYATSSDATWAAYAAAIQSTINANIATGAQVAVTTVPGSTTDDREIVVIAPNSAVELVFSNLQVQAGVSQATITAQKILDRTPATDWFRIQVYEYPDLVQPKNDYTVSFFEETNGLNEQMFAEYAVNTGALRSARIRVDVSPLLVDGTDKLLSDTTISTATRNGFLGGGLNGALATTQELVQAVDKFADRESLDVRVLVSAGYTAPEYHQKLAAVAKARLDCVAYLDVPPEYDTDATARKNYRDNVLNVDSSYGALFGNWGQVFDEFSGKTIFAAPTGPAVALRAISHRMAGSFSDAAGLSRGVSDRFTSLRQIRLPEGERDLQGTSQINSFRRYRNVHMLDESLTLQRAPGFLNSLGVRFMMIDIMIAQTDIAAYFVHEPNNERTWNKIRTATQDILEPLKNQGGIENYMVFCDRQTNTEALQIKRAARCVTFIQPIQSARFVLLDSVLTRLGGQFSFQDAIQQTSAGL